MRRWPCRVPRRSCGEHCAATGREHDIRALHELGDLPALAGTEARFAFDLENHRNAHARAALDLVVAVIEGFAETACEQPADGSLAGAHEADEKNVAAIRASDAGSRAVDRHARILKQSGLRPQTRPGRRGGPAARALPSNRWWAILDLNQ